MRERYQGVPSQAFPVCASAHGQVDAGTNSHSCTQSPSCAGTSWHVSDQSVQEYMQHCIVEVYAAVYMQYMQQCMVEVDDTFASSRCSRARSRVSSKHARSDIVLNPTPVIQTL